MSATETSRLNNELNDFKARLLGLTNENRDLGGLLQEGQEKLRLSASHVQTLVAEIDGFRTKTADFDRKYAELERRLQETGGRYENAQRENQGLAGQVRDAQEKLRLSAT